MWDEGEHCDHGVEGGCALVCENCGHTCKKHPYGNECTYMYQLDDEQCGCDKFERGPG